jgi:alcohol dehydrogenase (cytochrome c)
LKFKKLAFMASAVLAIGTIGAGASLYRHLAYSKLTVSPEDGQNETIWNSIACRERLYLQKLEGRVTELSWIELLQMTTHRGSGFSCPNGSSIQAGLQYSTIASDEDRKAGAQIFREKCAQCHGTDGSGGPIGPSLTRSDYDHGDSDLAIYETLRDGIPGTAMPSTGLPLHELLQVTAHVKMLQAHPAENKGSPATAGPAVHVSSDRLQAAGSNTDEWLTYSGSYNGWRHTSLSEITPANVAQLRVRWIKQFDVSDPNIEATPLVVGGILFMVADATHVSAIDTKTGNVVWEYKRPVPANLPLGFGRVNRGLAIHESTLFFGTVDGYLVAINANDGKPIWQTLVANPSNGYSITGAPLVVNDLVIVGIAGGEARTRGFLAAYDVSRGEQRWKFDTIPGPGEIGHETWGNDAWRTGGGATWITGSYDPSTDLLYWGVGNPNPDFSGDERPGDNLFTGSVIALQAKTGKLAWYFQFTPHDEHDWDAAQTPILADVLINGAVRKVLCWPNRNGFYYVLDRGTGEFLAGVPFVDIDWASGLTSAGRPILVDVAKVSTAGRRTRPGITGGTNWQNPSFDSGRGSVFVPAMESSSVFTKSPSNKVLEPGANGFFLASGFSQIGTATHEVLALDAATGRRKWTYTAPSGSGSDLNYSGLLSTEGGLVFGATGGVLFALDADTGREVWRLPLGGTTKSPPISFTVDGRQVIAVSAGRALFLLGL